MNTESKDRTGNEGGFFSWRLLRALLLSAGAGVITTGTLLAFLRPEMPAKLSHRTLTFAERVAYQRAIEDVYSRHRIWPKENAKPKPSLDECGCEKVSFFWNDFVSWRGVAPSGFADYLLAARFETRVFY